MKKKSNYQERTSDYEAGSIGNTQEEMHKTVVGKKAQNRLYFGDKGKPFPS